MVTRLILLSVLMLGLTSCAEFNCTRFEKYLGAEQNLINLSYTIADDLTSSAFPPLAPRNPNKPILTTTFVHNDDVKQTSKLGRILQEHLTSRLVQLGYTVQEVKLRSNLLIEPRAGETMLSRHLENLRGDHKAQAVFVGTISFVNRTMYLSTRLINPVSSNIISSKDYKICMDDSILAMYGLQRVSGECEDCVDEPRQPFLNAIF